MTQPFVVDFEVTHLSIVIVWRLPYPEIPTLPLPHFKLSFQPPKLHTKLLPLQLTNHRLSKSNPWQTCTCCLHIRCDKEHPRPFLAGS